MITRGYFIGQIIDELSSITEKMKNRAKLGLTDIHIHLEDFYRDILNITLSINLKNLNQGRKNSPGIDLGDETHGIAFQVTGNKDSSKVNDTLKKASSQSITYPEIKILTLQNKQGSYSIDNKLAKPFNFSEEDIWDVNDVLNKVMYLEIDKNNWYFFTYTRGIMQAISSNTDFNSAITETKPDKRKSKASKGQQPYQFMYSTDRKKRDFLRKFEE